MKDLKNGFTKKIYEIEKEIEQNNGVLPQKYHHIVDILKLLLKIAKIFTNDNIDKIIDKILLAIEVFENEQVK